MPDVYTTNPPKLRTALEGLGAKCGLESRVLHPRDKEWTCHLDSPHWQGDAYIHSVGDLLSHQYFLNPLILALISGVFIGLLWGKRFWRPRAVR